MSEKNYRAVLYIAAPRSEDPREAVVLTGPRMSRLDATMLIDTAVERNPGVKGGRLEIYVGKPVGWTLA